MNEDDEEYRCAECGVEVHESDRCDDCGLNFCDMHMDYGDHECDHFLSMDTEE